LRRESDSPEANKASWKRGYIREGTSE
jgi:hypothetical protein